MNRTAKQILSDHCAWGRGEAGTRLVWGDLCPAERANLRGAYLRDADLRGADLRGADLADASLRYANLRYANLTGANLARANLTGANLTRANLTRANLTGATGWQIPGAPDPLELRAAVAKHIKDHPELHNQAHFGDGADNPTCGTPCCIAGTACQLGGGTRGLEVPTAATLLLHVDGLPMPSFDAYATREDLLTALRAVPEVSA